MRAPRRFALGVLGGGLTALAARIGIDGGDAKKKKKRKKKKKCKKPKVKCGKKCCAAGQFCVSGQCATSCVLEEVGTVLRLQANCATTSTIVIPDGVDFDGNGKSISLLGSPDGFGHFGVSGRNATVENLTIDGSGLSGACDPFLFPVSLLGWDGGLVQNVTANNNRCGSGVAGNAPLEIVTANASGIRSETSGVQLAAIALGGVEAPAGTVAGCLIRDSDIGISLFDVTGSIPDNDIRNVIVGIDVFDAIAQIDNCTIDGPGSGVAGSAGISFESGGGGSVTGNTISNVECGIFEAADAGTVTESGNTFSGTGNNICVAT